MVTVRQEVICKNTNLFSSDLLNENEGLRGYDDRLNERLRGYDDRSGSSSVKFNITAISFYTNLHPEPTVIIVPTLRKIKGKLSSDSHFIFHISIFSTLVEIDR